MQEEFIGRGVSQQTAEVRQTYDLGTMRSNLTYIPRNENQIRHRHLLVMEAVHVLAGQLLVRQSGDWKTVRQNEVALFELNELHSMKAKPVLKSIIYPGITGNIAAVALVCKWIPPFLTVHKEEVSFIIENDWFDRGYQGVQTASSTTPISRLDKIFQRKFWQIVKRNLSLINVDRTWKLPFIKN